jgi:hypothetical protein
MDAGNDDREQTVLVAAKWLSGVGLSLFGISAACHHDEAIVNLRVIGVSLLWPPCGPHHMGRRVKLVAGDRQIHEHRPRGSANTASGCCAIAVSDRDPVAWALTSRVAASRSSAVIVHPHRSGAAEEGRDDALDQVIALVVTEHLPEGVD